MSQNATYENGTPAWGARRGPVMPYIPAVDGLRALSVIAVIVYHANKSWLGGGFLGVCIFCYFGVPDHTALARRTRKNRHSNTA